MDYKALVTTINGYFEQKQMAEFLSICTDDVTWEIVGDSVIKGKVEMQAMIDKVNAHDFTTQILPNFILVDGNRAMNEGISIMTYANGMVMKMRYVDAYLFEGEKVREMLTYCSEVK